jgi:hypothetical protein
MQGKRGEKGGAEAIWENGMERVDEERGEEERGEGRRRRVREIRTGSTTSTLEFQREIPAPLESATFPRSFRVCASRGGGGAEQEEHADAAVVVVVTEVSKGPPVRPVPVVVVPFSPHVPAYERKPMTTGDFDDGGGGAEGDRGKEENH